MSIISDEYREELRKFLLDHIAVTITPRAANLMSQGDIDGAIDEMAKNKLNESTAAPVNIMASNNACTASNASELDDLRRRVENIERILKDNNLYANTPVDKSKPTFADLLGVC